MKFLSKTALWLISGLISLTLSFIVFNILPDFQKTKVTTIQDKKLIVIEGNKFASEPLLSAPYKAFDNFISDEISPDFEFSSAGGSWEEITPPDTKVHFELKFKIDNQWSDWIDLEEEEDLITNKTGKSFENTSDTDSVKKYAMASSNGATAIKYKVLLYGDDKKVPVVKNVEWTFIKTAKNPGLENEKSISVSADPLPKAQYSSSADDLPISNYLAFENSSTGVVDVISRAAWGADESYRYLKDNNSTPQLVQLDPEFYDKYSEELKYSRIVEADENGNKYKWPLQYPEKVEKIIIHHTASTSKLDDPKQAIRDIYHYHAVTRGWGDIGYNYIVDQQGNVYEGRYGGEGVIGAHSGAGNHGSIGIAVMGNFQEKDVPQDATVKLSQFIYKKAKIHGINTEGTSIFRGKDRPNIFGHRDIMSTACPGEYLYEKIPVLRLLSAQKFNLKEKFIKDYDYQDLSETYYLELKPNQTLNVSLKFENIGKLDWNSKTYLELIDDPDFYGTVSFPGYKNGNLAKMNETQVKSGQTATFNFKIQAGSKAKTVYLNLKPVVNGDKKIEDILVIPITIQQPVYKYQLVEAKFPQSTIKAETIFKGFIKLKNNGNISWKKSGENAVHLNSSPSGIIANLVEEEVMPGTGGTFEYTFEAPTQAGYSKEIFNPVMANAKWISSSEVSFETTVYEREYHGELLSKSTLKFWEQEKNYTISVNLRNIGIKNWNKTDLKAVFVKEKNLKISDFTMTPATIKPGQIGTISFTVKIAQNEPLGEKVLLVRPMIGSSRLAAKPYYFQYKVVEQKFQTEESNQPKIRVKLGFKGNPEITANGTFEIYADKTLLTTLNAGDEAKVSQESGKYRVQAEVANFLKSEPIRFIPKTNSILKIQNFEHHPGWNENLNDNEYRGTLEVREVDGELVVINELYLEDYLKGLGEVSNSELPEKIKAIVVAARTYAKYYIEVDEKFPGKPYHLDDNPDVSQKYLGYGFEKRAPNIAGAVEETKGKVVTYEGKLVKTPYFNQSEGGKTKSAQEVWGWTNTPWLVSVDDTYCTDSGGFLGHGVGMSGCGAKGMAKQGFMFEDILKHYYTGVEVKDFY